MAKVGRTDARINLMDFKTKFLKILGPTKELQYWSLMSSFLSFKLTKAELDKLVPSTIGKENVVLHNQFVRAIFSNATCSDAPAPPPSVHDTSKPVKGIRRKPLVASIPNEEQAGGVGCVTSPIRANGDAIPSSPRKGRSTLRDRKAKERPSPLGLTSRGEASTSQGANTDEETPRGLENGSLKTPDLSRPFQQAQHPAELSNLELGSSVPPTKRARLSSEGIAHNLSVDGRPGPGFTSAEAGMEGDGGVYEGDEDDDEGVNYVNGFVKAPLGIPFCIASVGAPRRAPFISLVGPISHTLLGHGIEEECLMEGENDLPDTHVMRRRMAQIASTETGLDDVTPEAANLLNRALDIYLKRLIKPAIEFVCARRSDREKQSSCKENGGVNGRELRKDGSLVSHKQLNGTWPVHTSKRDGIGVLDGAVSEEVEKGCITITSLDFKAAMDVNPQLLGDNWPILMERISLIQHNSLFS